MSLSKAIWISIAASTVIYFVIVTMTSTQNAQQPFAEALRQPMVIPMYACAVAAFIASVVVGVLLSGRAIPRQVMVIRLAIAEAAAIFGLIAAFVNHDWRLYIPAWFLAVVGFFGAFPRNEPAL